VTDRVEDVVTLLGFASRAIRSLDLDVGRAGKHASQIGEENADPVVDILEKDHVPIERIIKGFVRQDEMRPLGTGHGLFGESWLVAKRRDGLIDPRSGGIHNDAWANGDWSLVSFGRKLKAICGAMQLRIIERNGLRRIPARVENEFDRKPFRLTDPGIVIG